MDRQRGCLIADVRLDERLARDALLDQVMLPTLQLLLVIDAKYDQRSMLACPFAYLRFMAMFMHELGHGMRRLDDLLTRRKISPSQDVHLSRRLHS